MKQLFLALLVFSSHVALACTCADVTPHSCNLLADRDVSIFMGTVASVENPPKEEDRSGGGTARYRFRVEEWFSAEGDEETDVLSGRGGGDCSIWFETGTRYLVFAYREKNGEHWASACSNTQALPDSSPLLTQLRAMRAGRPVARVYGTLRQTQQPYVAANQTGFDKPLGDVVLRFESPKKKLVTKTAEDGTFAVYDLPPGTYKINADLPADLELAQVILSDPSPPLQIDNNSCVERNIDALPKGKIRGQLLGSDGQPLWNAAVELFSADGYGDDKPGWWEFVDPEKKYFEFDHVSPGEYVLVFNRQNVLDTDAPYPRTFFRDAMDPSRAEHIHIGPGDQLLHTDIQLSGGAVTRKITIRVSFAGGGKPASSLLFVKSSTGEEAFPSPIHENLYELHVLLDGVYTITAHTNFCDPETQSEPFSLEGATAPAELTITVPDTKCKELPREMKRRGSK